MLHPQSVKTVTRLLVRGQALQVCPIQNRPFYLPYFATDLGPAQLMRDLGQCLQRGSSALLSKPLRR